MAIPFETNVEEYIGDYLDFRKSGGWDNVDNLWDAFLSKHHSLISTSNGFFNGMFSEKVAPNEVLDFHDAYIVSNVKPEKNNQFSIEMWMMKYCKQEDNTFLGRDANHVKFYFDDNHRDAFRSINNKTDTILAVVYKDETLGVISQKEGKMRGFVVEGLRFSDFEVKEAISNKRKMKF